MNSDKNSTLFWMAKGLAVIAIVACHCCHINEGASVLNQLSNSFMVFWMGLGVPVFYFFAGYFMNNDVNWKMFWHKKLVSIVLPWIFTGTLVWLYVVLRKGGISFQGWLGFVFLKQSYLYFLTDLFVFYIVSRLIRNENTYYIVFAILMILCIWNSIDNLKVLESIHKYINLNNYAYFLFGKCVGYRKWNWSNYKIGLATICGWVVAQLLSVLDLIHSTPVITCFGIMGMIYIAACMKETIVGSIIENWGRCSFSIYLLHMPVAGMVANVCNRTEMVAFLTIFRPLIVIGITMIMIRGYLHITKKISTKV